MDGKEIPPDWDSLGYVLLRCQVKVVHGYKKRFFGDADEEASKSNTTANRSPSSHTANCHTLTAASRRRHRDAAAQASPSGATSFSRFPGGPWRSRFPVSRLHHPAACSRRPPP